MKKLILLVLPLFLMCSINVEAATILKDTAVHTPNGIMRIFIKSSIIKIGEHIGKERYCVEITDTVSLPPGVPIEHNGPFSGHALLIDKFSDDIATPLAIQLFPELAKLGNEDDNSICIYFDINESRFLRKGIRMYTYDKTDIDLFVNEVVKDNRLGYYKNKVEEAYYKNIPIAYSYKSFSDTWVKKIENEEYDFYGFFSVDF